MVDTSQPIRVSAPVRSRQDSPQHAQLQQQLIDTASTALHVLSRQPALQTPTLAAYEQAMSYLDVTPKDALRGIFNEALGNTQATRAHDPDEVYISRYFPPEGQAGRQTLAQVFDAYRTQQRILGFKAYEEADSKFNIYAYEQPDSSSNRFVIAELSFTRLRDIFALAGKAHYAGIGLNQSPKDWLSNVLTAQLQTEAALRLGDGTLSKGGHELIGALVTDGTEKPGIFSLNLNALEVTGAVIVTQSPAHLPQRTDQPLLLLIPGQGIEEFANAVDYKQTLRDVWLKNPAQRLLLKQHMAYQPLGELEEGPWAVSTSYPVAVRAFMAERVNAYLQKQKQDVLSLATRPSDLPAELLESLIDIKPVFDVTAVLFCRNKKRNEKKPVFEPWNMAALLIATLIKQYPDLEKLQQMLAEAGRFNPRNFYLNIFKKEAGGAEPSVGSSPVLSLSVEHVFRENIEVSAFPYKTSGDYIFYLCLDSTATYGEPDTVPIEQVQIERIFNDLAGQYRAAQSEAAKARIEGVADIDRCLFGLRYAATAWQRSTAVANLALNTWVDYSARPYVVVNTTGYLLSMHVPPVQSDKSEAEKITPKVLSRYNLKPPQTPEQTTHVINTLLEIRASLSLCVQAGASLIDGAITQANEETIRKVTEQFIFTQMVASGSTQSTIHLLDTLLFALAQPEQVLINTLANVAPTAGLEKLLFSDTAQQFGLQLLKELDWYASHAGETVTGELLAQLVFKAVALVDGRLTAFGENLSADPVNSQARWGKSYATLKSERLQDLQDTTKASSKTTALLLARVLDSALPADYFIRDLPDDLMYGSVRWVNFKQAVNLAEAIKTGSSWGMSFQEVTEFLVRMAEETYVLETATHEQKLIARQKALAFAGTRLEPAVMWAAAHGIIPCRRFEDHSVEEIQQAVTQLDKHEAGLRQSAHALGANPPDRLAQAKAELERLKLPPDSQLIGPGAQMASLLDVYASEKNLNEWAPYHIERFRGDSAFDIRTQDRSFVQAYRKLSSRAFQRDFDTYMSTAKAGYQKLIASLLAGLPLVERVALEYGRIDLYGIRQLLGDEEIHKADPVKHQQLGRYGFILKTTHQSVPRFYEVFPRQMIIRLLPPDFKLVVGGVSGFQRIGHGGGHFFPYDARKGTSMPFDWAAYNQGDSPEKAASSLFIVDPLGTALASRPQSQRSQRIPKTLTLQRTQDITQRIANDLFYVNEADLYARCKGVTSLEKEFVGLLVLKAVVPFWGTIEDLASGDPDRIELAKLSALGDLMIFLPIAKYLGGVTRLVSQVSSIGFRAAIPRLGPLTGVLMVNLVKEVIPDPVGLLRGLAKLTRFGAEQTGARLYKTLQLINQGLEQFRKVPYPLLARARNYDVISRVGVVEPRHWKALLPRDELIGVNDIEHVAVRNLATPVDPKYALIDPVSGLPFGPLLKVSEEPVDWSKLAVSLDIAKAAKVEKNGQFTGLYTFNNRTYVEHDVYMFEVDIAGPDNRLRIIEPESASSVALPSYVTNNEGVLVKRPRLELNPPPLDLKWAQRLNISIDESSLLITWFRRINAGAGDERAVKFFRSFEFPHDTGSGKYHLLLSAMEQSNTVPEWAVKYRFSDFWDRSIDQATPGKAEVLNVLWRLDRQDSGKKAIEDLWRSFNLTGEKRVRLTTELLATGEVPDWAQQHKIATMNANDSRRFTEIKQVVQTKIEALHNRHSETLSALHRHLVGDCSDEYLEAFAVGQGYKKNVHNAFYRDDIGAVYCADFRSPTDICEAAALRFTPTELLDESTTDAAMLGSFNFDDAKNFSKGDQLEALIQGAEVPHSSSGSSHSSASYHSAAFEQKEGYVYLVDTLNIEAVPVIDNHVMNPHLVFASWPTYSSHVHVSVGEGTKKIGSNRVWLVKYDGTEAVSIESLVEHLPWDLDALEVGLKYGAHGNDAEILSHNLFAHANNHASIEILDLTNFGALRDERIPIRASRKAGRAR